MHDVVPTGSKRKRVISGTENSQSSGRSRSASRVKRRRPVHNSSDEELTNAMDVDGRRRWELSDSDSSEDETGVDSCKFLRATYT